MMAQIADAVVIAFALGVFVGWAGPWVVVLFVFIWDELRGVRS